MAGSGALLREQFSRSYNSFSGCDIVATFGPSGTRIGELQGVSFTVVREKAPIFVMGQKDPAGFSRGKRMISGSLVFAVFDRNALLSSLGNEGDTKFVASNNENNLKAFRTGQPVGIGITLAGAGAAQTSLAGYGLVDAWYLDQIPPFNIVLNAVNEYGASITMGLYNVEILNNGSGMSIDDIMIDETMTFTCTNLSPWQPQPEIITGRVL